GLLALWAPQLAPSDIYQRGATVRAFSGRASWVSVIDGVPLPPRLVVGLPLELSEHPRVHPAPERLPLADPFAIELPDSLEVLHYDNLAVLLRMIDDLSCNAVDGLGRPVLLALPVLREKPSHDSPVIAGPLGDLGPNCFVPLLEFCYGGGVLLSDGSRGVRPGNVPLVHVYADSPARLDFDRLLGEWYYNCAGRQNKGTSF